jgi:hypothetical protein
VSRAHSTEMFFLSSSSFRPLKDRMLKKCNQKDSFLRRKYSNCHSIPQCFFWMLQTLWNKKLFSCCCDLYRSLICTFLPCLDTVLHIGHNLYWIYFKIYCCPISKKLDGLGLALSTLCPLIPPSYSTSPFSLSSGGNSV